MNTTDTQALVERSVGGARSPFEQLITPLIEPAYRLACGMLLDRDDAVGIDALHRRREAR